MRETILFSPFIPSSHDLFANFLSDWHFNLKRNFGYICFVTQSICLRTFFPFSLLPLFKINRTGFCVFFNLKSFFRNCLQEFKESEMIIFGGLSMVLMYRFIRRINTSKGILCTPLARYQIMYIIELSFDDLNTQIIEKKTCHEELQTISNRHTEYQNTTLISVIKPVVTNIDCSVTDALL